MYGPGVEKVFEELKNIFPNKIVKIFSSDYLNKKKQPENLIKEIKPDILVKGGDYDPKDIIGYKTVIAVSYTHLRAHET